MPRGLLLSPPAGSSQYMFFRGARIRGGSAYIFPVVKHVPVDVSACACAIHVKPSMFSETTKQFRYKCHELFGNFPVMITVKSFLKCRSMQ